MPQTHTPTRRDHLAHFKSIAAWEPEVGDFIMWHGWLTHWYGIISDINPDWTISVIQKGLPFLLFNLSPTESEKSKVRIDIDKIISSSGGEYAILQSNSGMDVWYI